MIAAPVASASWVTSSPPTTSDSLLASARSIPSPSVATVGTSPAEPTIAFSTRSQSDSVISCTSPSGPREHLAVGPRLRGPRRRVSIGERDPPDAVLGAPARAAAPKRSRRSAPTTSQLASGSPETTSSAWTPIEPVEPRMARRRGPIESRISGSREPDVVAGDDREHHPVEPVERAAVGAEQACPRPWRRRRA